MSKEKETDIPLPNRVLNFHSKMLPDLWKNLDLYLYGDGNPVKGWDPVVFMPIDTWHDFISVNYPKLPDTDIADVAQTLAHLAPWRPTQDIVRFDPVFYSELIKTAISDILPAELFFRLPAWGIYFETEPMNLAGKAFEGFFADIQVSNGRDQFFLALYFVNSGFWRFPVTIPLGDWSLTQAIDMRNEQVERVLSSSEIGFSEEYVLANEPGLQHAINLVLYVCSYGFGDVFNSSHGRDTSRALPKKVKGGWRLFPPPKPYIRTVGTDFGDAIRKAGISRGQSSHAGPRPHIRRAHWHGYWTGPLKSDKRNFAARWLPPIPVALGNAGEDAGKEFFGDSHKP